MLRGLCLCRPPRTLSNGGLGRLTLGRDVQVDKKKLRGTLTGAGASRIVCRRDRFFFLHFLSPFYFFRNRLPRYSCPSVPRPSISWLWYTEKNEFSQITFGRRRGPHPPPSTFPGSAGFFLPSCLGMIMKVDPV